MGGPRICVICLSGMGNFLMFTPALDRLRKRWPDAKIDVVVRWNFVKTLLDVDKRIDNVLVFDEKKFSSAVKKLGFMNSLRKREYDISVCAYPSNRWQYNVLSWWTRARKRYSHVYPASKEQTLTFLLTDSVKALPKTHDVEQNMNLLDKITGLKRPEGYQVNMSLPKKELDEGCEILKSKGWDGKKPLVALHPSIDPSQPYKGTAGKRLEFFGKLVQALAKKGAQCVVLGGPNEEKAILPLQDKVKEKILFTFGQGIIQSAGIIKECKLIINIDSGLGHIGSVVGTPSITLFGPVPFYRSRPYNSNQRVVASRYKDVYSYKYPYWSAKQEEDADAALWYDAIPVEEVLGKVEEMIAEKVLWL